MRVFLVRLLGHIYILGHSVPAGLIESAFDELAMRWLPILNAFDDAGVSIGFEIHPGEDLHDGVSFEMFLERVGESFKSKYPF
jgi:sugar phosphate isomerase/epimerase